MNVLLLCHGGLKEFSSFTLAEGQTVQYRGNYGTPLNVGTAMAVVQALLNNSVVADAEIASQVPNYTAQNPLIGPNSFAPDIQLNGDDALLCFIMDMATRRWSRLGPEWGSTLSGVCSAFGQPLWLNLLCCTILHGCMVRPATVDPELCVENWHDILPR